MMFVASRGLILLLLVVDWAEDPQFGTSVLSAPFASSPADPLELSSNQETQHTEERGADAVVAEFGILSAAHSFARQEVHFCIFNFCIDFLFLFMSLQR